jgi:hypothetical protein
LIDTLAARESTDPWLDPLHDQAIRDTAFDKIRARVLGTALASEIIGGG